MSLEIHGNTIVYTRHRCVGGRPIRQYVASGEDAILAAELDAAEREAKREAKAAALAPVTATDGCMAALNQAKPFKVLSAFLVALGCTRKNRSWS